jgi:hypothetical protein
VAKAKRPVTGNSSTSAKAGSGGRETASRAPKVSKPVPAKPKTSSAKPKAAASKATPAKAAAAKTVSETTADKATVKETNVAAAEQKKPEAAKSPEASKHTEAAKPADASKPPTSTAKPRESAPKSSETSGAKQTTPPPASPDKPLPPTPAPQDRQSIFLPLVLGGAVAFGAGFLVSQLDLFDLRGDTSAVTAQLAAQANRIAALENAEPAAAPVANTDEINAQISAFEGQLAGLQDRLTAVEKQPTGEGASNTAIAAYERDLAALQASVEAQKAEIEALLNNAKSVEEATADAARQATLQNALAQVTAAVNSGAPFDGPLAQLKAGGLADVPEALDTLSQSGVVTLVNLQTRFPDAARAALTDARAAGAQDSEDGFGGFLRRQLGARSVAPREGSDPDAVLSRAEDAVRNGRLGDALSELETLPDPSKAAMQDWLTDARARYDAKQAIQTLSQRLTAN